MCSISRSISADKALELFINAVNAIDTKYYRFTTASMVPAEIERVICYELYHQFRTLLTDSAVSEYGDDLDFHGELRKNNRTALLGKVPDFLLHHAGNNNSNMLCVEVKTGKDIQKCDICRDIDKLYDLRKVHKYKNAVYLLVSPDGRSLERVRRKARELQLQNDSDSIMSRMFVIIKRQEKNAEKIPFQTCAGSETNVHANP